MNDDKISRTISTTTVQPNHDIRSQRMELTPFDLQLLKIHHLQIGLLFHKPADFANVVQHLKATLSKTLDIFYPLAGRLAMIKNDDKTASFHVDCNGAGALFVNAVIDGVTVADILELAIVPNDVVPSFFSLNGVCNYEAAVSNLPLLAVQVTELVDGYFLACTTNHTVADSSSFWHFFNVWSKISRNDVVSPDSVSFSREYLDGIIDLPIQVPFSHDQTSLSANDIELKQRKFHFSKEKIDELKARANAEMGFIKNEISSLQALLAHIWISVTRGRDPNVDEADDRVVASLRQRLQPPLLLLPEGYFGNAIQIVNVQSKARELLGRELGWAAAQIREAINTSVTEAQVREYLEDWFKSPILSDLGEKVLPNLLLIGSSPQFNVYGNDFGWGRPVAVQLGPANMFDGKLMLFPGAEEGSIDFEICLPPETLDAFANFVEASNTM